MAFGSDSQGAPARPPVVWKDLATITGDGTDWAVRVQTNDGGRPRYSYEFGKMRDGKFLRFVSANLQTFNGVVTFTALDLTALAPLVLRAEAEMVKDAERREAEFQARRPPRNDGGGFGRPEGQDERRTGKTDRQRAKGKAGKPSRRGEHQRDW